MNNRDPELHILQHALGLDDYGQGSAYRNHYVVDSGSEDFARCEVHAAAGRMLRRGPSPVFGGATSYSFQVTSAGREYVRKHSPKPPKTTPSQRRYRRFLDADCGLTFGEWLRTEMSR